MLTCSPGHGESNGTNASSVAPQLSTLAPINVSGLLLYDYVKAEIWDTPVLRHHELPGAFCGGLELAVSAFKSCKTR